MSDALTLPDLLSTPRASSQEIAIFEGKGSYRRLTAAELRAAALRTLGALQAAGLGPGDELVMPIEDIGTFLTTFWACQLGGIVAMPLSPPSNDASCAKILDILGRREQARVAIDDAGLARLNEFDAGANARLTSARVALESGTDGVLAARTPNDVSFVQYSSGSTRAPKGVIVRHGQALANLRGMAKAVQSTADDRTFSWMPLSHDMGLVGFHLGPLHAGADQVLMPTSAFARTPLMWLEDVSSMGATILSSPNFGYRHYLKAAERKGIADTVDLSRVRLILNGAEPISVDLATEFMERLAPQGLAAEAMFPVYGLAEATLAVTFPRVGERIHGLRIARGAVGIGSEVQVTEGDDSFVTCGCGQPIEGVDIRIAGEDGGSVAERHIGRIWMRGESVTEGYLDDEEATAAALQGEGWFDTGDLGFLADGELFIAGRRKDLVIVDGQNFYPHDIEESLCTAFEIDPIRVAVAPVRRAAGTEDLAVFVQHRGEASAFKERADAMRAHLSQTFGVGVELVVPVQQIPRTTSGKVQRAALALALQSGDFDEALAVLVPERVTPKDGGAPPENEPSAGDTSPEAMEAMVIGFCDDVLGGLRFGPTDNLFEQGMSSIDLAEIHGLIEARYPKGLDIRDFFDSPTIRGLSAILSERVQSGAAVEA